MTDLIYEPKGRAREYAELACNIYNGCDHGCLYCYAPKVMHKKREQFDASLPRTLFIDYLQREVEKKPGHGEQVLLCFACDSYQNLDSQLGYTRETIKILHRYGYNVCVLTKGGTRALRDLDLFTPKDAFAATMTFTSIGDSLEWEPNAAQPAERIKGLIRFHEAGIPTWVSLEPVIKPRESLELIKWTHSVADGFKVGKLNYHPLAKTIDWGAFGHAAIELLEKLGYRDDPNAKRWYYVKNDLRAYL